MLKNIFGFGKKSSDEKSSGKLSLSPAVRETILNTVGPRSIPVMPGAAQKAFALASNPRAEARDFVDVIEQDEALAARVIKIANSVFFDRGNKSSTIEDAVVVIGLNELRNLLNANALSDIFPSSHPVRAQLWAHDIAVALIAKQLAKSLLPSQGESCFLAGLMHDVGKLLLLQRSTASYEKVLKTVEQQGLDFSEAEVQEFPFDHCEVGLLIGERWNFSADLNEAISAHHAVNILDGHLNQTKLIKISDIIAHSLGLGLPARFSRLRIKNQERLPELWEYLKLSESDAQAALQGAKRNFETEYDLYSGGFGK